MALEFGTAEFAQGFDDDFGGGAVAFDNGVHDAADFIEGGVNGGVGGAAEAFFVVIRCLPSAGANTGVQDFTVMREAVADFAGATV